MNARSSSQHLTLLYDRAQIRQRVRELAAAIRREHRGRDVLVVCVLKGAFVFLADLVREMGFDVSLGFVSVSSYGLGTESTGSPIIQGLAALPVEGADLLIVEDILDTGISVAALLERVHARSPRSVRLCVLIDKCERRSADVTPDYVGFELRKGFVVGYGIDHAERYRHLPEIFAIDREGPTSAP